MYWEPPFVRFWTQKTLKSKFIRRTNICFGPISGSFEQGVGIIKYVIPIHNLTDKQIQFYLKFVSSILDKSIFSYRHFRFKKNNKNLYSYLHLSLNTKGMSYKQSLLYLTFFRYFHEFPELIIDFCDNSKNIKDDSALFNSFIKTSIDAVNGKIKYNYYNLGGHGLICSPNIKITLDKFRSNLKDDKKPTVHSFFIE